MADYQNRLKAIQTRKRSPTSFASTADAVRANKLNVSIQNIINEIDNATKQYQAFNNSIIDANTKGLTPEYSQIYNSVAGPTLRATDAYVDNVRGIFANTTRDSGTLIEQNINEANALAQRQTEAVSQVEANQAGLVAGVGTRAGLNAGQILAGQSIVNADKDKQLAAIEQSRFDNVGQQRSNYQTLMNNFALVQQGLEAQRLQNVQGLNSTAVQVQQANLARQQQQADLLAAQQAAKSGSGG